MTRIIRIFTARILQRLGKLCLRMGAAYLDLARAIAPWLEKRP
jgi:hypothetical protein